MKKSLLALFAILIFIGCSKDDDESIDISFKKSELINIGPGYGYYLNVNYNLCISTMLILDYDKKETKYAASESQCPNRTNHNKSHNIIIQIASDVFECDECKARFNPFTGKPANDEAKGYKLKVYNTTYNEASETYRVWR